MSQKDGDQRATRRHGVQRVLGGGQQSTRWSGRWRMWLPFFLLNCLSKPQNITSVVGEFCRPPSNSENSDFGQDWLNFDFQQKMLPVKKIFRFQNY